jgi:hypothetical protein
VLPLRTQLRNQRAVAPAQLTLPKTIERVREIAPASTSMNDEELLSDAFARSRVSTLSALDDMTPHARDIALRRRGK